AWRLRRLGYEIDPGKNGAPEIRGYTREYIEASSPRSRQIRQHLEARGLEGAGPAQIAAHRTRDAKATLSPQEMLARHREVAAAEPRALTTREMMEIECDNIARMQAGQGRSNSIAGERDLDRFGSSAKMLSESQRRAVVEILSSRDQVLGIQGTAGAGKTTSL